MNTFKQVSRLGHQISLDITGNKGGEDSGGPCLGGGGGPCMHHG